MLLLLRNKLYPRFFTVAGIEFFIFKYYFLKNLFVSATTTPLRAKIAIIFGIAMRPLKISAMVHTADTVM